MKEEEGLDQESRCLPDREWKPIAQHFAFVQ